MTEHDTTDHAERRNLSWQHALSLMKERLACAVYGR